MLRFLWFDDVRSEKPRIVAFRFCRLVFGLTLSPAIMNGVIQQHLTRYFLTETAVTSQLSKSLYVDDFTVGTLSAEEELHLYCTSKKLMQKDGFNFHKWRMSSAELRELIDSEEGRMPSSDNEEVKILGLKRDLKVYEFQFDFQTLIGYAQSLLPSKHSVLRLSAKLFDLLGMLSPFTVGMKILFQKICKERTGWAEILDGEALSRWNVLMKELKALAKVPRCYYVGSSTPANHQLHGFSDASEHVFAAVINLQTIYSDCSISVRLVASKTRVAPMKKQTIPRLELLGANTLARLFNTVQNILKSLP